MCFGIFKSKKSKEKKEAERIAKILEQRRLEQEQKEAAAKKKAAEKDARFAEVTSAIDNAYELLNKCIKDYGEYVYTGNLNELDMDVLRKFKVNGYGYEDFLPTKLLHYFLF